ncbi:hypothetical protein QZH41_000944 [Actinostola sp. cb2023]|nr:hypothetical protein QZH41_000944 [Actinostola sp. cb2023]
MPISGLLTMIGVDGGWPFAFYFFGFLFFIVPAVTSKTLIASISMSKINGTVTFNQASQSSPTTIDFRLDGITEELAVHIHSLPMIYHGGASTSCSNVTIGDVYDPTNSASGSCSTSQKQKCAIGDISGKFGNINQTSSKNNFNDSNLPLSGKNGIYGRTLVFTTTSGVAKACALVTSEDLALTAIARFKGPIAGTVYFRQPKESAATLLYANLFFVNDAMAKREFYLEIHAKRVSGKFTPEQCSSVGDLYNPFGIMNRDNCNKTNHVGCPVGDLLKKLGPVYVSSATAGLSTTQVAYTDVNLPVLGAKSVIGLSLVLYARDNHIKPIACTNIAQVLKRTAKASFTSETTDGVAGTFEFSQASPFDPTEVEIDISNLRSKAEGFHVHEYPNPSYKNIKTNTEACSKAVAGDHLNPYGIVIDNSPPQGTGTVFV